jgi:hypothetical protein
LKAQYRPFSIFLLVLITVIALPTFLSINACRTPRKIPIIADSLARVKPEIRTSRFISKKLSDNEFNYEYLTTKFSAEVDINGKSNSFNVNVRAKKDSILWMSFSLLGVEGARLLATADTVKFMDRMNSKYFVGDYQTISSIFRADIDFELMQSVLIGNSVEFYDEDEKLKVANDSTYYLLSTIRKRRIRKMLSKAEEQVVNPPKELIQRIWIHPVTYKIIKNIINDFNTNRTFIAEYSDFQRIDSLIFPYKANFQIKAQEKIDVKIKYSKVTLEKPQSFTFKIPSGYEPLR